MQKNLTQFKIGYGPMSKEIIDILLEYSKSNPLMVICSRNQVDYKDSYVCDQTYISPSAKNNNILLCRDHCGPYFKDSDRELSLTDAVEECKKTIAKDIESGFELIHIDVSKVNDSFTIADILIEFALKLNPNILIEFGSEENTGKNLNETFTYLENQISYCQQYKPNVKFIVSQTGSLIKERQIGCFNVDHNLKIAETIHQSGFLFKEHNGDYLTKEDVMLRKQTGIDAINIAPQLGVIQTELLFKLANGSTEFQNFKEYVYRGNKFQRWLDPSLYSNKDEAVRVSGHYFFGTDEYKKLIDSINSQTFYKKLKHNIFQCLDTYKDF